MISTTFNLNGEDRQSLRFHQTICSLLLGFATVCRGRLESGLGSISSFHQERHRHIILTEVDSAAVSRFSIVITYA